MNRQNRANSNNNNNNNMQHPNNPPPPVNFDNILSAASLPLPPRLPGSLTDPANFPMIPNLMDLLLMKSKALKSATEMSNTETTSGTANTAQASPPVQRYVHQLHAILSVTFLS